MSKCPEVVISIIMSRGKILFMNASLCPVECHCLCFEVAELSDACRLYCNGFQERAGMVGVCWQWMAQPQGHKHHVWEDVTYVR